MPLPETLPRSPVGVKRRTQRLDNSFSKYSTGWTTDESTDRLATPVVRQRDDNDSWDSTSRSSDEDDRDDHYRIRERRNYDSNARLRMHDDESIPSICSNSILSSGSGGLASVSIAGTEASESDLSTIYEPKEIRQRERKQASKNNKASRLPEIPEEKISRYGCGAVLSPGKFANRTGSWKRIWKKNSKVKCAKEEDRNRPRHSAYMRSEREELTREEACAKIKSEDPSIEQDQLTAKNANTGKGTLENRKDFQEQEAEEDGVNPIGWISLPSWVSNDVVDFEKKHSVQMNSDGSQQQHNSSSEELPGSEDKGSKEYYRELAPMSKEEEITSGVVKEKVSQFEKVSSKEKSIQRRGIPSILPMPKTFRRNRSGNTENNSSHCRQIKQREQRQRILSILQSKDDAGKTELEESSRQDKDETLQGYGSRRFGPTQEMDVADKISEEEVPSTNDAAGDAAGDTAGPKSFGSSFFTWEHSGQAREHDVDDIERKPGDHFSRYEVAAYSFEDEAPLKRRLSRNRKSKDNKNNLSTTVGKLKAKRMMNLMNNNSTSNSREPSKGILQSTHEDFYLKSRQPEEILEEKKLLKAMDKFVKKRLRALENIEKEISIEREEQKSNGTYCGCFLCP